MTDLTQQLQEQLQQQVRNDILSITEDKLKQLTNAGLVKRAYKSMDKGDIPAFAIDADATLTASFSDEHQVTWKLDTGLAETTCTCPAPMCRHRVQLVLSYRAMFDNPEVEIISPHLLTADELKSFAGKNLLPLAKKLCNHGIMLTITPNKTCPTVALPMATVQFWGGANLREATCNCIQKQHCPHVLLAGFAYASLKTEPTSTLELLFSKEQISNFLNANPVTSDSLKSDKKKDTPNDKGNAQNKETLDNIELTQNLGNSLIFVPSPTQAEPLSCERTKQCFVLSALTSQREGSSLHLWGRAREGFYNKEGVYNKLATEQTNIKSEQSDQSDTVNITSLLQKPAYQLQQAERLLFENIIIHGAVAGLSRYQRLFDDVSALLKTTKETWLQQLLAELADWLSTYEHRGNDFAEETGFELISDYLLRSLARNNVNLKTNALGVGLKHETAISTARLTSLGCRLFKTEDDTGTHITSKVMLIDSSHTLLVNSHKWQLTSDSEFNKLSTHRINSRITLQQLAYGQLTCHRAKRMANHEIHLNTSRVTYNQVLPQTGNWRSISEKIGYQTLADLKEIWQKRPISVLRGHYSQPNFVVLAIKSVLEHGYDPATESYIAIVTDINDETFIIKRTYRSFLPNALPALATAFNAHQTENTQAENIAYVAGVFDLTNATKNIITIDPWAIVTDKLYVPDSLITANKAEQNKMEEVIQHSRILDIASITSDNHQQNGQQNKAIQLLTNLKQEFSKILFQGHASSNLSMLNKYLNQLQHAGFTELHQALTYQNSNDKNNNTATSPTEILHIISLLRLYLECI